MKDRKKAGIPKRVYFALLMLWVYFIVQGLQGHEDPAVSAVWHAAVLLGTMIYIAFIWTARNES